MNRVACAVCGNIYSSKKNGLPHGHGGDRECRSPTAKGQRLARELPVWVILCHEQNGDFRGWALPDRSGITGCIFEAGIFRRSEAADSLRPSRTLKLFTDAWFWVCEAMSAEGSVGASLGITRDSDFLQVARDQKTLRRIKEALKDE